MKKRDIVELAQEMADLTRPRCGACPVPLSCCEAMYCEGAIGYAKRYWNVELSRTDHPKLPMMGPDGCTAPPHLRPLCTVHVCERHYMFDPEFYDAYFRLREEYNIALLKHDYEVDCETTDQP